MTTEREVKSPDCPYCGHPPGPAGNTCLNMDCVVVAWDTGKTPAEIRAYEPEVILDVTKEVIFSQTT